MLNKPMTESILEAKDLFRDFHFVKADGDSRLAVDVCTHIGHIRQFPVDVVYARARNKIKRWLRDLDINPDTAKFLVLPREGKKHGDLNVTDPARERGTFLCRVRLSSIPCTAKAMQF